LYVFFFFSSKYLASLSFHLPETASSMPLLWVVQLE
jgi:hypothetical protein